MHRTGRRLENVLPQEVTVQLPRKGNRLAEQPIRCGYPPSLTPNVRGDASRYRRARSTGRTSSRAAPGSRIGTETSRRGGAPAGGIERGVRQICVRSSACTDTVQKGGGGGERHQSRFCSVVRRAILPCSAYPQLGLCFPCPDMETTAKSATTLLEPFPTSESETDRLLAFLVPRTTATRGVTNWEDRQNLETRGLTLCLVEYNWCAPPPPPRPTSCRHVESISKRTRLQRLFRKPSLNHRHKPCCAHLLPRSVAEERRRGGDDTPPSPSESTPPIPLSGSASRAPVEPGEGAAFVGGDAALPSPPLKDASHRCISEISWFKSRTLCRAASARKEKHGAEYDTPLVRC